MIKIKVSTTFPEWPIIRQTLNSKGIWNNCKFFINQDIKDCDFWVVYDGLMKEERTNCPKENTILITGEPSSVKKYSKSFLDQFGLVITSHKNIKHRNVMLNQQAQPWIVGLSKESNSGAWRKGYKKDFNNLSKGDIIKKEKIVSIISSDKKSTKGHRKRLEFVLKLKEHFGNKLDVFGSGLNQVSDKWDVIAPYKYHIVLENSSYDDYWTEKLSDCFLAEAYPFYFGCKNINKYFPKESLDIIDVNNSRKSIKMIEEAIENDKFKNAKKSILNAKQLVLKKYNLFAMLSKICERRDNDNKKEKIVLKPELEHFLTSVRKKLLTLDRVGLDNESNRDLWIKKVLTRIPEKGRILDAGAGELKYKKYCSHLEYVSQDFGKYDGQGNQAGLQTKVWDNTKLDIISDIVNIPEKNAAFDVIMCIEVFEHLPNPIKAIEEFSRLLKKDGTLIITAPFASLTHFAPYHFSSGYNKYFYEHHLEEYGLEIIEYRRNGNYFEYLAQEIRRIPEVKRKYSKKTNKLSLFFFYGIAIVMLKLLAIFSKEDKNSDELLCFGYHILAKKKR